MTDRIHSLTVVLEKDIREDDCQPLIDAIKQLRGVLTVDKHVANMDTYVAEQRVRLEFGQKLIDMVFPTIKIP